MKTTRYDYICERCGHCRLSSIRVDHMYITCRLCLEKRKFLLCAIVTDHGEYEEWERI